MIAKEIDEKVIEVTGTHIRAAFEKNIVTISTQELYKKYAVSVEPIAISEQAIPTVRMIYIKQTGPHTKLLSGISILIIAGIIGYYLYLVHTRTHLGWCIFVDWWCVGCGWCALFN